MSHHPSHTSRSASSSFLTKQGLRLRGMLPRSKPITTSTFFSRRSFRATALISSVSCCMNHTLRRSFHQSLCRAKGPDVACHFFNQLCKTHAFGGRHPAELDPAFLDAYKFEKVFQESELSSRTVIACQVVALSGVASAHQHAVNPFLKAGEDEEGVHPSGARHTNDAHIGRILDPAGACKIRPCIAAPVAEKSHDLRFPFSAFCHCSYPNEALLPQPNPS